MKSLRARVKFYLTRPRKAISPCSEILCMTTLAGLPPELLLSISDFLPLVDLICFSVCNHRLLELSLRQINRLPPLTQDDKLSILTRLEQDLPGYFACDVCNLLHRYDGSESFGLSGLPHERTCRLPCVRTDQWFRIWFILSTHATSSYSPNDLSFLQLKLAMRRFYYGPGSGISTDSLSYTQVRQDPIKSVHPDTITLFSREAQICPEPLGLYIRMQDIVVVKTLDELPNNWRSEPFVICQHFGLRDFITPMVESLHNGQKASFAHNCHRCNTDSQIEISAFESKMALIMTRWVNLGPGLTDQDPLWKAHVCFPMGPGGRLGGHYDPEPILGAQSPRLCFEDTASQSFEDLRSRNLSYLRDQQYKKVMPFTAAGRNVWHISYKEPSKKVRMKFLRSLLGRWAISRKNGTVAERTRRSSPIYGPPSPSNRLSWPLFDIGPLMLLMI